MAEQKMTIKVDFVMATDDGTDPVRRVAEHAHEVGRAWTDLGDSMLQLATSLDDLVNPKEDDGADS